jgi:DNA-binding response OmpR family regulator
VRIKPCALVLDDDPIFRKMLEVVMSRLGLTVKAVETAEEFWAAKAMLMPDIFLIDLQLGAGSGLALIEDLRINHQITTPVIVISGNADPAVISHALEIGANEYILKPFDKAMLALKLGQFVHTDELDEQEKLLRVLDGNGQEAKVTFSASARAVDELGIKFESANLVSKGTLVRIAGAWVTELTGKPESVLWVTSTSLCSTTGTYEIYAEFEGTDLEVLQSVRRWLIARRPLAA